MSIEKIPECYYPKDLGSTRDIAGCPKLIPLLENALYTGKIDFHIGRSKIHLANRTRKAPGRSREGAPERQ